MAQTVKTASAHVFHSLCIGAMFSASAYATALDDVKPGDVVSGSVEVGKRSVPLPAGQWELLAKTERTTGEGRIGMVKANFFEVVDQRLTRLLSFEVNKNTGSMLGDWNNEPCKNKGDSYALDDLKNSFRDQNCIRVGFLTGIVDQASGDPYVIWARRIKDDGIAYSRDMPFVQVTRYKPGEWVFYQVSFNPQMAGIAPSREQGRNLNDWNPLHVDRLADKKAFYEGLRQWAPRLADAVQKSMRYEPVTAQDIGAPELTKAVAK